MTTVDADIIRVGGAESISFHNGLFGPATDLLVAAIHAVKTGVAVPAGKGGGGVDVTLKGTALRPILRELSAGGGYRASATGGELAAFLEGIVDDGDYTIRGFEF